MRWISRPASAASAAVDQTFGYNADGTMQWSKDGAGHQTSYSNWYRGIPKNVGYATGENASVAVSNIGAIDSWTDERGSITSYDHDAMGRLTGIHYPSGDPGTGGNQVVRADNDRLVDERFGLDLDRNDRHLPERQPSTTRCCVRRSSTRTARAMSTGHTTATAEPSFVSIPSTIANESSGTTFQYDGLGRVTAAELRRLCHQHSLSIGLRHADIRPERDDVFPLSDVR